MKKTIWLVVLMLLSLGAKTWAQDSKIETGIIAFDQQKWKDCIKALDEGLKDPSVLKPKNLPRGYFHRGKAHLFLMGQEAQAIQGKPTEAQAAALEAHLMSAYNDFKQAKATDDGKWGKKVDDAMANLNVAFLNAGLAALNLTYDKAISAEDKKGAYKEVQDAMDLSIEIDPNNYFPFDLRAQARLGLADSTKALEDFKTATKLVEGNTHQRPDLLIGYIYYRKALIERFHTKNIDAALESVEKGKAAVEKEWTKYAPKKAEMKPEEFAKLQSQYESVKEDLSKFELDLLLNAPEKLQQAIDKFKDAISKEPSNYVLHVAYAQLLEKVNKTDEAAVVYENATKIDPSKQMAWFNLGAMYVNKAVALYKLSNETTDDAKKAKELQGQGDELFRKALPFLQKANDIDKCDADVLRALLQITINLQMTDDYAKYKAMEKQCKGQ